MTNNKKHEMVSNSDLQHNNVDNKKSISSQQTLCAMKDETDKVSIVTTTAAIGWISMQLQPDVVMDFEQISGEMTLCEKRQQKLL